MAKPLLFYLQCKTRGYVGNSPLFWRAGGAGYTQWLDDAQKMTRAECRKIISGTRGTHQWKMWPVNKTDEKARRTIDVQDFIADA